MIDKEAYLVITRDIIPLVMEYALKPVLSAQYDDNETVLARIVELALRPEKNDANQQALQNISAEIARKLNQRVNIPKNNPYLLNDLAELSRLYLNTLTINLEQYQTDAIVALARLGGIRNRIVLEVAADVTLSVARCLIALGAAKVIAVNPAIPTDFVSPDERIVIMRKPLEEIQLESHHVDAILGIAILEHMNFPREFAEKCKFLLKENGSLFLTGGPMWTSHGGHHVWLPRTPSGRQYFFHIEANNPWEPWEHLTFDTEGDATIALRNNNIPDIDIPAIIKHLFRSDDISRITPTEVENVFKEVWNSDVTVERWKPYTKKNEYFYKALQKYSEEDLLAWGLIISKQSTII